MDSCFVDITVEFLAVAFHNIMYYASIYPKSIFEPRKKYSVVVYHSMHPEVNQYIDLCLKSVSECLKSGKLSRVEFAVTNNTYEPVLRFVFDLSKDDAFDEITDSYLVQTEQNMRAFCLRLTTLSHKFKDLPDNCSFTILLHTDETTAVAMAVNPNLEEFPFVEAEHSNEETNSVIPLKRFSVRNFYLDSYIEIR